MFLHNKAPSSLLTQACNPSGDIKVLERWSGLSGSALSWLYSNPPVPSQELCRGVWAKAHASRFLERRAPRKAGFTEQRPPPALGSGRITGWCHSDPTWPLDWSELDQHFFILFLWFLFLWFLSFFFFLLLF
ncbi:unnamed protein product [Malus baccata var. baccata]